MSRVSSTLPDELLLQIVSHLHDSPRTLCTLARTSRSLQSLAESQLYSTIELLSTAVLAAIIRAFDARPERVRSVQTLKILYRFDKRLGGSTPQRARFNAYVKSMVALKNWYIESPYDNFQWEFGGAEWVRKDMVRFQEALDKACHVGVNKEIQDVGLSRLEKLTIHSHGTTVDFWDLDGFYTLFRHPSLRFLHVSCVSLPKDLPQLEPYAKSTPLETIEFNECELVIKSLGRILQTPKALKHLTLGENVYNTRHSRSVSPRLSTEPQAAMNALMTVAESLESLTHYDPLWKTLPHPERPKIMHLEGDGMRNFNRLTFLNCDPCSFLHQGIIMNQHLAPPNLEILRVHRYPTMQVPNLFEDMPPLDSYRMYLRALKTVELVQPTIRGLEITNSSYICQWERVQKRHAKAYALYKEGINLKVFAEIQTRQGVIPPYLHGERPPVLVCVYDAAEVGFQRTTVRDDSSASPTHQDPQACSHEIDMLDEADMLALQHKVRRSIAQLWMMSDLPLRSEDEDELSDDFEGLDGDLLDQELITEDEDADWGNAPENIVMVAQSLLADGMSPDEVDARLDELMEEVEATQEGLTELEGVEELPDYEDEEQEVGNDGDDDEDDGEFFDAEG